MSARRTLTDAERMVYGCPDWCERWDHDADRTNPGDVILHFGPDFGQVWVQGRGFGDAARPAGRVSEDVTDEDLTTEDLRKLAADVLAAAEWLEAHRPA